MAADLGCASNSPLSIAGARDSKVLVKILRIGTGVTIVNFGSNCDSSLLVIW
jgi:hypothetical protein